MENYAIPLSAMLITLATALATTLSGHAFLGFLLFLVAATPLPAHFGYWLRDRMAGVRQRREP